MLSDPLLVMAKLSRVFDRLGVEYLVGGSMASAAYGIYRPTQDVDFVANLRAQHARLGRRKRCDGDGRSRSRLGTLRRKYVSPVLRTSCFRSSAGTEWAAAPLSANGTTS